VSEAVTLTCPTPDERPDLWPWSATRVDGVLRVGGVDLTSVAADFGTPTFVLDVEAMDASARALLGEHDFLSYCKPRQGATTIRTLRTLQWRRAENDDARLRVVVDQIASLTDTSARAWHARLCGMFSEV